MYILDTIAIIMLSSATARKIWRTACLPVIDFFALVFGSGIVYLVRYRWFDDNFLGTKQLESTQYITISIFLAAITIGVYTVLGLYEINRKYRFWQTVTYLGLGVFLVLLGLITFLFFNEYNSDTLPQGVPVSRFILATGGFFALYFVYLGRAVFWALEQILYNFGLGKLNVALISDKQGYMANELLKRVDVQQIINISDLDEPALERLEDLMRSGELAEIYLFAGQNGLEVKLATLAERYKVNFIFSPEGFSQYQAFGLEPLTIGSKVFLAVKHTNLDGWWVVIKRIFDISASLGFMLVFGWLYLLIAMAIKLDSPGPVFYGSERVGPNGKVFRLWKFRRFRQEFCTSEFNPKSQEALAFEQQLIATQNLKKDGVLYKIKDDPRSTRVGKFIEKYSLDELPQFFNVLVGNMSLVGPRPHQPREVAKYDLHHFKVLNIKPGVTGLAQVNGRSDLSFEEEVAYDTLYVERWSFWLDIWVVLKTPFVIFFNRHQG